MVIAIIGILATLLLLQLNVARAKARDTKRIADITQIRTAIEIYYDDNATYPSVLDPALNNYMQNKKVPTDPTTGVIYGYGRDLVGGKVTKYQVWGQLEQLSSALKSDADINAGWTGGTDGTKEYGNGTPTSPGKCTAGGLDCIFDLGVN